jgi:ABC-2 type transport system permease protein
VIGMTRFLFNVWTLAAKDLRLLLRDPVALFWVFGFPLLFALFFGSVLKAGFDQETSPLSVAVVDSAHDAASAQLLHALERSGLALHEQSASEAQTSVRRAKAVAYLEIPAAFVEQRRSIGLGVDPAHRVEAAIVEGLLQAALRSLFAPPSAQAAVSAPSIHTLRVASTRDDRPSGFMLAFPAMILWGVLGCAATFAVSIVAERTSGTLVRLRAAPMTRFTILAGKAAACFISCTLSALALGALGVVALGVELHDPGKLMIALASTAVAFTGITIALSVLGRTEQSVAGAGWATLIVMAMLGGAMVPLSFMPKWLVQLSDASPVKWGILALEGASFRSFSWAELAEPLSMLLGVGGIAFALGGYALGRQES